MLPEGGVGEWTEVRRKRQTTISNDNTNIVTNVYVAGFQNGTMKSELWKIFAKHGMVVDVYLGRKKDTKRQNFAFFRFKRVADERKLEEKLHGIGCRGTTLTINLSKHPRKQQ